MIATQDQVRSAINSSGATGTASEVLNVITNKTIIKTDSTRKAYSDVAVLLDSLGQNGNMIVDTIRDDLLANGPKWVCDQLGGSGIDFSHDRLQLQIDTLVSDNRLTPQLAAILKGIGVWYESPLEIAANQRGITTDETTVQLVLDTIASEQEPQVYDHRQALFSLVIQPNGSVILSCRVVATTETGKQGETLSAVSTTDADSFDLPNDLATALAAVRQFVAGV